MYRPRTNRQIALKPGAARERKMAERLA